MQKIVQQVLKLTAASEARLWTELESQLVSSAPKLSKDEFIDVVLHYGDNEKGTPEFWNNMAKIVNSNIKNYDAGEIMNIFDAFSHAGSQYKMPTGFAENMMKGVDFAAMKLGEVIEEDAPGFKAVAVETIREKFQEFDETKDLFVQFTDDLENLKGVYDENRKKMNIEIIDIVKQWQKEILNYK